MLCTPADIYFVLNNNVLSINIFKAEYWNQYCKYCKAELCDYHIQLKHAKFTRTRFNLCGKHVMVFLDSCPTHIPKKLKCYSEKPSSLMRWIFGVTCKDDKIMILKEWEKVRLYKVQKFWLIKNFNKYLVDDTIKLINEIITFFYFISDGHTLLFLEFNSIVWDHYLYPETTPKNRIMAINVLDLEGNRRLTSHYLNLNIMIRFFPVRNHIRHEDIPHEKMNPNNILYFLD